MNIASNINFMSRTNTGVIPNNHQQKPQIKINSQLTKDTVAFGSLNKLNKETAVLTNPIIELFEKMAKLAEESLGDVNFKPAITKRIVSSAGDTEISIARGVVPESLIISKKMPQESYSISIGGNIIQGPYDGCVDLNKMVQENINTILAKK